MPLLLCLRRIFILQGGDLPGIKRFFGLVQDGGCGSWIFRCLVPFCLLFTLRLHGGVLWWPGIKRYAAPVPKYVEERIFPCKKGNAGKTGSLLRDGSPDRVPDEDTDGRDDGEDDDPGEYSGCAGEPCCRVDICQCTGERGNKAKDDPENDADAQPFSRDSNKVLRSGTENLYAIPTTRISSSNSVIRLPCST